MCNESSSIIDFYPKDFESDLNGKQQNWEAVVLIPFIDEKRLLEAMEPCTRNLSPEEQRRKCWHSRKSAVTNLKYLLIKQ